MPRSGAVPDKGPVDIRDLWTSTSRLSRTPDPGAEGVPSRGYQLQVRRTCPAPLTRVPPRRLSSTPPALTLAVTAAKHRETAEELGGAAAPPPTRRRGSGSRSQQALP